MIRSDLSLEAVTRAERIIVVDAMNTAIGAVGGWIEDFNAFSNISVAIRCVVPAQNLFDFEATLHSIGLKFDANELQAADADRHMKADMLTVSINVTFVHGDPDLRRTVPSVPG